MGQKLQNMIVVKKISGKNENGTFTEPSRNLTKEEASSVIARWGDEGNYWYFTKQDVGSAAWNEYQKHLNNNTNPSPPSDKIDVVGIIKSMSSSEKLELKKELGL
jgi:hypothetical protein